MESRLHLALAHRRWRLTPEAPNCPRDESRRKGQQNQRLADKLSASDNRYEDPARE